MPFKADAARVDLEKLLPVKSSDIARKPQNGQSSLLFKIYVIVTMTFLWTGYTLLVRYTRSTTRTENVIRQEFLSKPSELMKMSVPSIAYALQNNLDFIALSNLDAGVYQVTTQLKVVTTAIFMMIFLSRRFSLRRWIAISLLFCGVALVQLNSVGEKSKNAVLNGNVENYLVGITAVLCTCATAGFAGVYFEKMLKDGSNTPFWIRNLQMYSCGVVSAFAGCFVSDIETIRAKGFFHGYSMLVVFIIAFLSCGGIYISLVMKHLDNLHKSFASAVSIILVTIFSLLIFEAVHIGIFFVLGTTIVCFAIMLYNSVNE
uniref:UDP-galactose transporter n=2 Tax=Acrobeloides nanus TaxID=290746 RepID=A0A914C1Q1_9BILA